MQDIPVRSFESSSSLRQFVSSQYRAPRSNAAEGPPEQVGLDTVGISYGPSQWTLDLLEHSPVAATADRHHVATLSSLPSCVQCLRMRTATTYSCVCKPD